MSYLWLYFMSKRVVKRVHHFSTLSFKHLGIRYLEGERLVINLTMTTVIFLISRWSVTFFNTVDKRSPSNMLKIAWLKHMFHFVVSSLIILAEGNICRVDFYDKSYKNLNRYVLCNSLIITYPCSSWEYFWVGGICQGMVWQSLLRGNHSVIDS